VGDRKKFGLFFGESNLAIFDCLRYLPRYYRVSNAVALLTPILFLGNERMRVTFGVTAILFVYCNSIGALLRYFVSIAKVSARYSY
jgi:hypothetical protein